MSEQHQHPAGPLRPGEVGRRLDVFMHGRVIAALDSPDVRGVKLTYAEDAREVLNRWLTRTSTSTSR